MDNQTIRVLFVCMGNICRSPLGEGVMRQLVTQANWHPWVEVASAGTHFYHVGDPPDPRSVQVAQQHGYDISQQRAQQLDVNLMTRYDYLLVMDQRNLRDATSLTHDPALRSKLALLLDYSRDPLLEREVPDPYHGGPDGFIHVLRLVESGCRGLMLTLAEQHPQLPELPPGALTLA